MTLNVTGETLKFVPHGEMGHRPKDSITGFSIYEMY